MLSTYAMTRVTVSLPDDVAARLKREARRRHVPVSEVVRAAIDGELRPKRGRRIGFAAVGRSGKRDVSRRVDEILREEWSDARDR